MAFIEEFRDEILARKEREGEIREKMALRRIESIRCGVLYRQDKRSLSATVRAPRRSVIQWGRMSQIIRGPLGK